jgi:hypothetical protein
MMERQGPKFSIECDECAEADDVDTPNFNEAWHVFSRDGWTARKIGDQWTHKCPGCNRRAFPPKKEQR